MPFFDTATGNTGGYWLWNQFADAFTGKQDVGAVSPYLQIAVPGAPSVAVNTTTGNLTGNYQYAVAFITGYWNGPMGSGTFLAQGNTGGGTASAVVSPSAEQVNVSSIPVGPTGVYERSIYRTKANGSTFYFLTTLTDNTTTSFTDNIPDTDLGAVMPTTNTTGSYWYGPVTVPSGQALTVNGSVAGSANTGTWSLGATALANTAPWTAAQTFNAGLTIPSGQNLTGAGGINITGTGTFGGLLTANAGLTGTTGTFSGALALNGGGSLASGQTLTNDGTISGGTISGVTLSGTFAGTPTFSGLSTFSAGITGTGTTGTLTAGTGILGTENVWTANQLFPLAFASQLQSQTNIATNGWNLQLQDTSSGNPAPNKFIRAGTSGNFEIVNSAFSSVIGSLTDAGAWNVTGQIFPSGGTLPLGRWAEMPILLSAGYIASASTAAGDEFIGPSGGNYGPTAFPLYTVSSSQPSSSEWAFQAILYNSTSGDTVYAALWDITAGAIVSGTTLSTTNNSIEAPILRSATLNLVPGHTYGVTLWVNAGTGYIEEAALILLPS